MKKKIFIMNNEKKNFGAEKSRTGLLPKCVVTHSVCCDLDVFGRWNAGAWALGAGRAGMRQALGVRGRAGGRCRRAGAQRQAELAAGWASGSRRWGARARRERARTGAGRADGRWRAGRAGDGRQARGQAWHGRAGAPGWAHGARGARPAWAWPGRWRVAD